MKTVEERLRIVEDIEEIKHLKAWYAECADGKYTDDHRKKPVEDLDAVAWQQALCFTEDAAWDAGQFGVLNGRQALFESFRAKPWVFTMHMFMNPHIHVDGDTGTGRWVMWMLGTDEETGRPMHLCGYTNDEYRRVDGRWLFSKVVMTQKFLVPFDQPWTPAA